jgi:hydrogenase maturation protease
MMPLPRSERVSVLVAGVGNLFLRDDAFGSEVARRLEGRDVPPGVRVADYGIGGIHLAYDLLDGVDLLVLVDAVPRGVAPGTLTVLEADPDSLPDTPIDSHAMDPAAVLANVRALGGQVPRTLIVGCEPADVGEGIGLSPAVEAALEPAMDLVLEVVTTHAPMSADKA